MPATARSLSGAHLPLVEEVWQLLVELCGSPVWERVDEEAPKEGGSDRQKHAPQQILDTCTLAKRSLLLAAP